MTAIDQPSLKMEERDFAVILLPSLEYESQLQAIGELLRRLSEEEERTRISIEEFKDIDMNTANGPYLEDERIDLSVRSVYQDAAHSMAAIGMLAPLVESIFFQVFSQIGEKYNNSNYLKNSSRVKLDAKYRWDCHYIFTNQRKESNLRQGIFELSNLTNLAAYIPSDLGNILAALFEYRNKMFHCGFEWPLNEREKFSKKIQENHWSGWFSSSTSNGKPWIFYMTKEFITKCISVINEIIGKLGTFAIHELPSG